MKTNKVTINWNDLATVKLSPHGLAVYRNCFHRLNVIPPRLKDRVLTEPLWQLAQTFGSELYMGNPQSVFESMNIDVQVEASHGISATINAASPQQQ